MMYTEHTGGRTLLRLTLWVSGAAVAMVCAGMNTPDAAYSAEYDSAAVACIAADGIKSLADRESDDACGTDLSAELPSVCLNQDELDLLARVISAEARGESFDGQVAVGAVVMNRVNSDEFPDTVAGVCYQPGAFSGVADGQIDLAPSPSCIAAAEAAAAGVDPTGGSLYFYNPKTAANDWIRSRPVVVIIGNHCFCV